MTNEVKNVPELRFPGYNDEWKEKKLEESLQERKTIQKVTDEIPLLAFASGQGVIDRSERKTNNRDFLTKDANQKRYLLTKKNDIVYNPSNLKYGAIDRNKKGTGVISPIYVTFESIEDPSFMELIVKSYKFQQLALRFEEGTVTKRQSVKPEYLLTVLINVPQKSEQKKIGDFFSKLDRQIELEEQKLAKLEEQKKGYMQKIFSQEVRFKDDNGNSYPEWESAPLFDIFSATKGKSLSKDKISDDGKYECILYGEIYTTYAEKIESIVSRTNYYEGILSKKNDLIFPNSTTTNAWDLATFSSLQKNNVLIGGDISILRTKRSDISSLFYAYYLTNYLKLRKDIAKYAQGITIVHLSFNNFCKIKVQIPSLEEQNSITDFIDSLNQQQKLITNKIKLLKERKKGFLQKMFV